MGLKYVLIPSARGSYRRGRGDATAAKGGGRSKSTSSLIDRGGGGGAVGGQQQQQLPQRRTTAAAAAGAGRKKRLYSSDNEDNEEEQQQLRLPEDIGNEQAEHVNLQNAVRLESILNFAPFLLSIRQSLFGFIGLSQIDANCKYILMKHVAFN